MGGIKLAGNTKFNRTVKTLNRNKIQNNLGELEKHAKITELNLTKANEKFLWYRLEIPSLVIISYFKLLSLPLWWEVGLECLYLCDRSHTKLFEGRTRYKCMEIY